MLVYAMVVTIIALFVTIKIENAVEKAK